MTCNEAKKNLLEAARLLEAIRPQAVVVGDDDCHPDNVCIQQAWAFALEHFRQACVDWLASD